MRYQGKLVEWHDAKGFGFVLPNAGGMKFFVHMNDFAPTPRRPAMNDLITFEMGRDKSGRSKRDICCARAYFATARAA